MSSNCVQPVTGLLICVLLIFVHTKSSNAYKESYESEAVDYERLANIVNDANSTWTADLDMVKNAPHIFNFMSLGFTISTSEDFDSDLRLGANYDGKEELDAMLPEEFDLRKQYPMCNNIGHIMFQADCGSCWAVSSSGALSDRMCISTKGRLNHPLSADHLLSCCPYCTGAQGKCSGGDPIRAWIFIKKQGIPTGSDYGSLQGCKPYRIPPCNFPGYRPCHQDHPAESLTCAGNHCTNPHFQTPYFDNLYFVNSVYAIAVQPPEKSSNDSLVITQEDMMKYDIYKYGSIVAAMDVYQDFALYKKGVYQHISGENTGGHAVKIIGWGTEGGVPYWLCVNSWSILWGDKGVFKIRRGVDECSIETMQVSAGHFDERRSSKMLEYAYDDNRTHNSTAMRQKETTAVLVFALSLPLLLVHK